MIEVEDQGNLGNVVNEVKRSGGNTQGTELAIAVEELRARVQSLEAQLGVKDTQIGELHRLMATTALQAAPARPWWRFWG